MMIRLPSPWLVWLLLVLIPGLAWPQATANPPPATSATTAPACPDGKDCAKPRPKREVSQAMAMTRAALDDVVARYQIDRRMLRDLVRGSKGVAVFTNLIKVGFLYTETHGQGFLVYRQADGRWGPPVMLEVVGRSFGPQIGARVSDVLVVFKSTESIIKLLTGQYAQGLLTPGVTGFTGATESSGPSADIVSYSLNRGLMLGQSVDEYHVRLLDQANMSLYDVPLKAGDIFNLTRFGHIPGPVQDFVQHVNLSLGEPANKTEWSGPATSKP
jgi:lipid-binding SYLF domain-containing protein